MKNTINNLKNNLTNNNFKRFSKPIEKIYYIVKIDINKLAFYVDKVRQSHKFQQ